MGIKPVPLLSSERKHCVTSFPITKKENNRGPSQWIEIACVLQRQGPCWGRPRWTLWSSWRNRQSASAAETWGCGTALASDACLSSEAHPWRAQWPWCPGTKYQPGETTTVGTTRVTAHLAIERFHWNVWSLLTHFHRLVQCFVEHHFLELKKKKSCNTLYHFHTESTETVLFVKKIKHCIDSIKTNWVWLVDLKHCYVQTQFKNTELL